MVTIIIPNYNHERFILDRLNSICNQTFKQWEAIIIDDHSTDGSLELIESYLISHPEFKVKHVIVNEVNSGSGYLSWLKGLELADTKYVWIAETDDFCTVDFLEQTVLALETNPSAAIAFTASTMIDKNGQVLYNTNRRFAHLNLGKNSSRLLDSQTFNQCMPMQPLITNASAVVFRNPKSKIPVSLFNFKQISDLFIWTYLLADNDLILINKPLNTFRRHEDSTTERNLKVNQLDLYAEYCQYVAYFKLNKTKSIEVIHHYFKHCLKPKRKTLGYFNVTPISNLPNLSKFRKYSIILGAYLKHLIRI